MSSPSSQGSVTFWPRGFHSVQVKPTQLFCLKSPCVCIFDISKCGNKVISMLQLDVFLNVYTVSFFIWHSYVFFFILEQDQREAINHPGTPERQKKGGEEIAWCSVDHRQEWKSSTLPLPLCTSNVCLHMRPFIFGGQSFQQLASVCACTLRNAVTQKDIISFT